MTYDEAQSVILRKRGWTDKQIAEGMARSEQIMPGFGKQIVHF